MRVPKFLKWSVIAVGSLLGLLLVAAIVLQWRGRVQAKGGPEVAVKAIEVRSDSATIARGRHIIEAIAPCAACHGAGLQGAMFETPPILVAMAAPNLTAGKGGVGQNTVTEWDRAIRHGIGKDGRRLIIMPSHAYAHMTDEDFTAVVAHLSSLDPIDNELPTRKVGILGALLVGAGLFPLPAKLVEHEKVGAAKVTEGATAAYGGYLSEIAACRECHGSDLNGLKEGGGPSGPSLMTAKAWSAEAFAQTMRSGRTPDGRQLDPAHMPWPFFAKMTADELQALWLYIQSLPAPQTVE